MILSRMTQPIHLCKQSVGLVRAGAFLSHRTSCTQVPAIICTFLSRESISTTIQVRQYSSRSYKKSPKSSSTPTSTSSKWESVIGLEIHAQINTRTKAFAASPNIFNALQNTNVALWDAAIPGTLPVLGQGCVEAAVMTGVALDMTINPVSYFDRKHYFYYDLPSGYQITQYRKPIAENGSIRLAVGKNARTIRIQRVQIEHDSGKTMHTAPNVSLVDLNRAGTGLMEIITEPDIRSSAEAGVYVQHILSILTTIGSCNGNLQEGSLRVDANISIRPVGTTDFGTRTEVKNISGIRFLTKAIDYEIQRQIGLVESGQTVLQETRTYDVPTNTTVRTREKSGEVDYRYMPEPDLPPLIVNDDLVDRIRRAMPELPLQTVSRLMKDYGLTEDTSTLLVLEPGAVSYFEACAAGQSSAVALKCANWIVAELFAVVHKKGDYMDQCPIASSKTKELVQLIDCGAISGKIAKEILERLLANDFRTPLEIVTQEQLLQISDQNEIELLCEQSLASQPDQVLAYQKGRLPEMIIDLTPVVNLIFSQNGIAQCLTPGDRLNFLAVAVILLSTLIKNGRYSALKEWVASPKRTTVSHFNKVEEPLSSSAGLFSPGSPVRKAPKPNRQQQLALEQQQHALEITASPSQLRTRSNVRKSLLEAF